jgi:hypothetical protein
MRKTIAAVTAGLLLVAGQAAASNDSAVARVGDRVGARAADSSEFQNGGFMGIPVPVFLIGTAVFIGLFTVVSNDESESA